MSTGTGSPREVVTSSSLNEFNKYLDSAPAYDEIVGVSCNGPGVGLDGPGRSHPTQPIQRFHDSSPQVQLKVIPSCLLLII